MSHNISNQISYNHNNNQISYIHFYNKNIKPKIPHFYNKFIFILLLTIILFIFYLILIILTENDIKLRFNNNLITNINQFNKTYQNKLFNLYKKGECLKQINKYQLLYTQIQNNCNIKYKQCINHTQIHYPSNHNIKLIGRSLIINNTVWLIQSGSAIEFEFEGNYLSFNLITLPNKYNINYLSEIIILINDVIINNTLLNINDNNIILINEIEDKKMKIKIIKIYEEQYGSIGITLFKIKSSTVIPIKPTINKKYKIEFLGDSITCGTDIEININKEYKQNYMKTYAYLLSSKLNVDYYTICYSDISIMKNNDYYFNENVYISYGIYNGFNKYKFNYTNNNMDYIFINLGSYDYYKFYNKNNITQFKNEFKNAYLNLLKLIRNNNPNAYIISTIGMIGGEIIYNYIKEIIIKYKELYNDNKILYFLSPSIKQNNKNLINLPNIEDNINYYKYIYNILINIGLN